MNTLNIKRIGLISSIVASSLLSFSCDGGSSGDSNNTIIPTDNTSTQNTPDANAEESYTITIHFVSGGGLGYKVGDTILVQRTESSIIVDGKVYSPYEEIFDSTSASQYSFDAPFDFGIVSFLTEQRVVQVNIGLGQIQGRF
jgi:hypothetical protein